MSLFFATCGPCCVKGNETADGDSLSTLVVDAKAEPTFDFDVSPSKAEADVPPAKDGCEPIEPDAGPGQNSCAVAPEAQAPPTSTIEPDDKSKAEAKQSGTECKADEVQASPAAEPTISRGVLGEAVHHFKAALALSDSGGEVVGADRENLILGFESYAVVLDKLGNIGSYLLGNTKKLRDSKADAALSDYKEWMLSELPVHASTKYKGYEDKSAWMGNLWIGWTLEFFVELFAKLHSGMDTQSSIDAAYKTTLYNHHNFLQRSAFTTAVKKLPPREKIYEKLAGNVRPEDVEREVGEFVALGRPMVKYLADVNDIVDKRLQEERKAFLNRK